ncbi:Larval cuticle protein LCP-17 [Papilio machaon]|uniref:Larval cuticle protein LCP-17 n=1 Tax=Papilio machaon TaxID=76193 RepID=A0A0N1I9F1_PAPMA|nr:Larval cuticle protein LCP-17 [Papilio machaon]
MYEELPPNEFWLNFMYMTNLLKMLTRQINSDEMQHAFLNINQSCLQELTQQIIVKFLVLFAAVALASADVAHIVRTDESQAPILKSDYNSDPVGNYQYAYETGNGIAAQAEGIVKNPNSEAATLEVKGSVRYTSPDGTPVETTYVADENGYQAQGSHIPVPPPIPELILRSLQYIADHPPPAEYIKKTVV